MGSASPPGVRDTAPTAIEAAHAVRALVEAVSDAWAAGDADAFVDHYADEASAILPGFALLGRAAIRSAMAQAFATGLKGSRRIHQVHRLRFPGTGTAIVTSRSGTAFPGEVEPPADRWSMATWVLSGHSGRWLIEAYHDCPTP
jgi:uncharacterized protein (TIGR02246 family)